METIKIQYYLEGCLVWEAQGKMIGRDFHGNFTTGDSGKCFLKNPTFLEHYQIDDNKRALVIA